ncbi:NAD(P)H-binding protein [Actinomyces sp. MRS3W]|uniref:NAD(P)H-binding protein n=1 Tax=Actinomyces sp. MRS3W TaxID=2800796 RepID=UPI0028FD5CF9|nr:NAD(P)H-binding protein [Actinomyces sp. MRS3W]MDU0348906.1 NAD(P)H-binding protein [Actinomyces sp. MRS3W]
MSRIVIVGGHGKVALLLAPLLVERGDDVVSLIRTPEHADDVAATGAVPLVVSVEEASEQELAAAFDGADAVVWSAGAGGKGGPERTEAVDRDAAIRSMEAAKAASVPRYVMVSFAGSHGQDPVPADHPLRTYAMAKLAADRHLVASDLDWTIVGPGLLTLEEPSGRIEVGRVEGEGQAPTSRANVAAVIAAVLAEPATVGKVIPFRDGETPIAEAIADVPVEYADLDN